MVLGDEAAHVEGDHHFLDLGICVRLQGTQRYTLQLLRQARSVLHDGEELSEGWD